MAATRTLQEGLIEARTNFTVRIGSTTNFTVRFGCNKNKLYRKDWL